ncbi:Predicted arabinose efflux permease, MFS family [Chitinophaga filiformis]|uniref:Predicted arabinose efflux permease, MFS family n=2 Tax=Chitinophaga filiformis TaxID=104663 RepID=A0A1G7VLS0_CHIFI|nr:Predicted arabinose efflux permease, MFS family [Chitinophaga filiformis]
MAFLNMQSLKHHTFRAFQNRNFTLFFMGQSLSQIGTWTQQTAVIWIVYTFTHSSSMIGVAVFAQLFPSFLLSIFGGIITDRYNRYKILIFTQIAAMIQAIFLAALVFTNHYVIWQILLLSIVLGAINALDVPARQTIVHEMVNNKADLTNAIALNSAMANLAKLTGPALSGLILQRFGASTCFIINAGSFIAVIISLLLMKLPKYQPPPVKKKVISELAEGFSYLRQTPAISMVILLITCLSMLILPYDTLEPVFAKVVFKGNAATYGYISSSIGLGALIGTLLIASVPNGFDLIKIVLASIFTMAIGLILFSQTRTLSLALPFALILGAGSITPISTSITIIQTETHPRMRGRVMGYVVLAFFGMLPLGSLLISTLSQQIGAPMTMLCQGIAGLLIVAVFYRLFRINRLSSADTSLDVN